ncbi:hypothetical protein SNEBB_009279 [Seison nebaliae]|nr:hypothetical protein SNEBB_009279 [Seison nebaliae]
MLFVNFFLLYVILALSWESEAKDDGQKRGGWMMPYGRDLENVEKIIKNDLNNLLLKSKRGGWMMPYGRDLSNQVKRGGWMMPYGRDLSLQTSRRADIKMPYNNAWTTLYGREIKENKKKRTESYSYDVKNADETLNVAKKMATARNVWNTLGRERKIEFLARLLARAENEDELMNDIKNDQKPKELNVILNHQRPRTFNEWLSGLADPTRSGWSIAYGRK